MSIDYHTAQGDFGSIVNNLQPMVLSNFVMWLDLKVAEFKVYGQMILDGEQDMSKWFLHPPNAGGGTQSIPRRKSETVTTASVHNKHRRPPSLGSTNIPSKQIKTEHVVHRRNVQKNDPVSIDLTDNEALTEMTVSDLSQTPGDEAFSLQHLKQEPQLTPSSPKTVPSPVRRPSFVERSVLQNVKNTEHIYSEQPSHLPSSTFSPSSQIAEKSNVSSSLDSSQMSSKQNQQQTLADIHNVMTLKAEPEESEFECITKEEQDISFDTSTASQLLDNVTVTSVIPNIAGVTDQEEAEYHSQTIMKNDGTMFVVDSEQQQTIERQHGMVSRSVQGIRGVRRGIRGSGPQRNSRQHHPKILELAIANVKAGKMSQTKAAELYGIPQPTISYHIRKNESTESTRQLWGPSGYEKS